MRLLKESNEDVTETESTDSNATSQDNEVLLGDEAIGHLNDYGAVSNHREEEGDIEEVQNADIYTITEQNLGTRTPPAQMECICDCFHVLYHSDRQCSKGWRALSKSNRYQMRLDSFLGNAALYIFAFTVFISVIARFRVLENGRLREQADYEYLPCDIHWNGMFGLGGGIVKGPLIMLVLGVHPAVTSATAACMILFTSFTATSAFVVFGLLIPDYALLLMVVGFFATIVGQLIINHLVTKYCRHSLIAFSIGIVVALSAVSMTIESVFRILQDCPYAPCSICGSLYSQRDTRESDE